MRYNDMISRVRLKIPQKQKEKGGGALREVGVAVSK